LWATSCLVLLFQPLLDTTLPHISQILDHIGMMRDAIDNVAAGKVAKLAARKFIAFKTPRHLFLDCTFADPTLLTMARYSV
jgi:hypothetical protein